MFRAHAEIIFRFVHPHFFRVVFSIQEYSVELDRGRKVDMVELKFITKQSYLCGRDILSDVSAPDYRKFRAA